MKSVKGKSIQKSMSRKISLLSACVGLSMLMAGCDTVSDYLSGKTTDYNDGEDVVQEQTTTTRTTTIPERSTNSNTSQTLEHGNDVVQNGRLDQLSSEQAQLNQRLSQLEQTQRLAVNEAVGVSSGAEAGMQKGSLAVKATNDADDHDSTPTHTIAELTLMEQDLGTLHQLLVLADMNEMLASGRYTLLAPNNQAFTQVPKARMDALRQNKQKLREVLMNHLIPKPLSSSDLVADKSEPTVYGGKKLTIVKGADGKPVIQQIARVVRPNLWASNGMVQVIDRFLIPAEL